ncbi:MAG: FmdB family transcriptional regulator [Candidatus Omnitrophica bacterium CG08_land_8_20_14_0_20_41_16]|uniref:FmdB family transcriptional regulator n=1 Tax=Candidatus Sherwoodlollariibacterium unditelluris TaxID=1974757 RepID=A0A2G9YMC8_9BACT|nr:MAG: FmdB family transcriptional regulator [Candidatus Omnitrophica bacterium CG23_combo_of_CG06-09_8_20_14_all_41_10]PIS33981.1 MAG: FmdB family transcriptional regulator [Candidatus Omnitrophica bacterium CG08_land_8_20_14_0_20_41_16]
MPTYEYECVNCNKIFDIFQYITDKPFEKCPKCGGKIKRLIGKGSGIIFKGPGFYATDYRKSVKGKKKSAFCASAKEGCSSCPNAK